MAMTMAGVGSMGLIASDELWEGARAVTVPMWPRVAACGAPYQ